MRLLNSAKLEAGFEHLQNSPRDRGTVELIVRRPAVDQREVLDLAELDLHEGLLGDSWCKRPSKRTADGRAHPDMQLNLMNSRVIDFIAGDRERWPLAGDQFFVDLDLSAENLAAGTRLELGSALIEITSQPHSGCKKFSDRYGLDALEFVNSDLGKRLHLRGVNARVLEAGQVRHGGVIRKQRVSDRPHC